MEVKIALKSRKYPGLFALIDSADRERVVRHVWNPHCLPWATYAYTQIDGTSIYLHRFITGVKPRMYVDHINHDGLDNRQCNLRICTNSQNMSNRKGLPANNSSGYLGVYASHSGKWQARLWFEGKHIGAGTFESAEEAARARDEAALLHFGEFARLNFPMEATS